MPKVHCDVLTCEFCQKSGKNDSICGREEITIVDDGCLTYIAHVVLSPEYRETFWKRMRSREDKHECKKEETQGKRYEMAGLVWFTDMDDRWGTDELWFTEERSGLRSLGKQITEENAAMIKGKVNSVSPVADLPEATLDDL